MKLKKELFLFIFFSVLIVSIVSCGKSKDSAYNDNRTNGKSGDEILKIVEYESLNEEVHKIIRENEGEKGYLLVSSDEKSFLVVYTGEKENGGYTVGLSDFKAEGDILELVVEDIPPKSKFNTAVISYPSMVLQLFEDYQEINVKDTEGKLYKNLKK